MTSEWPTSTTGAPSNSGGVRCRDDVTAAIRPSFCSQTVPGKAPDPADGTSGWSDIGRTRPRIAHMCTTARPAQRTASVCDLGHGPGIGCPAEGPGRVLPGKPPEVGPGGTWLGRSKPRRLSGPG